MIPTSSSISTNGCDNISSNCVIWQGPDIACITLCNGDSTTEVVSKLATEVCTLITDGVTSNPSLAGLDLSCLNIPGITPTELVPVLQAMIVEICANSGTTTGSAINSQSRLSPTAQVTDDLPIMTLPACMQYDDARGNPVTQLRLDLFASLIATHVCQILNSITLINSTLTNYSSRLDILEACVLPCTGVVAETQVIPTCVLPAVLTNVSVLLLALEAKFCSLETAVGLPSAIVQTISQTNISNTSPRLSSPGSNYGSIAGWNSTPSNLAQSVQNAWVVIDDMYTAISSIQLNCCPSGCDAVTFRYTTTALLTSTGEIGSINFDFINSSIPASFNDCAGSTMITITDITGIAQTSLVSVSTLQNEAAGVTIAIPTLNTQQPLDISVAFCVVESATAARCSETQTSVLPGVLPCPSSVTTAPITSDSATIGFINQIGNTAVYVINIYNNLTGNIAATYTVNSPSVSVSHIFTGLIPSTQYYVSIDTTMNGATVTCSHLPAIFTTSSAAALCSAGMDVAFIIDYSFSMSTQVDYLKTNINAIVAQINTESGVNDYQIGVALTDESTNTTPTYETSTDYVSLPAAQKITNTGISTYQFMTALSMFAPNNGIATSTQLNKINTGSNPPADWPIGEGSAGPEPTDTAIALVVGANEFVGQFRTGVAKYLLIYTDDLPSGSDDTFNSTDVAFLNSLAITCAQAGIKCIVLGRGNDATYTPVGGTATYPWRTFATSTGGSWNVSYTTSTVISEITNSCS